MFLLIFIALSVVCIIWAKVWANADETRRYTLPSMQETDPIEVALLRGGENAVIRTAVFDLWQNKVIELKDNEVKLSELPYDPGNRIHRVICRFIRMPRRAAELFSDRELKRQIRDCLSPVYKKLEYLHLLQDENGRQRVRQAFIVAFVTIFGIGGTKLALGLMRDKPVGFLIILMIISFIALLVVLKPGKAQPTNLGKHYIKSLKKDFGALKYSESSSDMTLALAIFGAGILAGTAFYEPFNKAFASTVSGGSDSGGCGGGCGGGGGGCGGGGCGGCGGS